MLGGHARRGRCGLRATNRAYCAKLDTKNVRCRKRGRGRGLLTIPPPNLGVSLAIVFEVLGRPFPFFLRSLRQALLSPRPPLAPKPLPSPSPSAVAAARLLLARP